MNNKLNQIYNIAFDIIELRLSKKEPVVPFTVTLEPNKGKPTISMYEQVVEKTADQIKIIRDDLSKQAQNGQIEALCLCYDMYITDPRTNEKTDAISIELTDGKVSNNIYVPYDFNDSEVIKKPFQTDSDKKYF